MLGESLRTGMNRTATKTGRGRPVKRMGANAVAIGPRRFRTPRIQLIGQEEEVKLVTDSANGDGGNSNADEDKSKKENTGKKRVKEGNHEVKVLTKSRPGPFYYKSSNEVIPRYAFPLKKRR